MNKICKKLVEDADAVLQPKSSFTDVAENIYEQGYMDGMAMVRKMLRLQFGLSVPADLEDSKS